MIPLTDPHGQVPPRLEQLLEVVTDGVLALDVQGRPTYVNTSAERILGRSRHLLLGRRLWTELPGLEETELHRACHRALAEGTPVTVEEHLTPLGAWLETRVFPTGEGLLVLLRDVTVLKQAKELELAAQRRARQALEQERDRAEEANRAKDDFLATVSHELRTPLTAILGWTNILRTNTLSPEKQTRALETVERSARAQAQIVDDLLDISRIVAGRMRLDMQPVKLTPVVEAALEAVRPVAVARSIKLEPQLEPGVGPVQGDPQRLQQVAWNLLTNAIKFTPDGGTVSARLRRVEEHVELQVTDSGKGIAPAFLPHVFERFRQADGSSARRQGGLGLGLAIVRHLVDLHGGTVQAHSEGEGHGSTFTLRLPLIAARGAEGTSPGIASMLPDPSLAAYLPDLSGVRVLVVDDEQGIRELLRALLEERGAEVSSASSAAEALEQLQRAPPDLLVSDIGMPDTDGYAFIRQVRALPPARGGQVPAAALTAYTRLEDRTRALSAGFHVYVPKPVDPIELVMALANLINRFART